MLRIFITVTTVTLCGFAASLTAEAGEAVAGWRGNWTGRFPDAKPPVTWGRVTELMRGLRCQAEKPKGEIASGDAIPHGCITQWLVLGPFPTEVEDDRKAKRIPYEVLEAKTISNEADVAPTVGETVEGKIWEKANGSGSVLEFEPVFGVASTPSENARLALAHTYLYSDQAGELLMGVNVSGVPTRIYFNGTPCTLNTAKRIRTVALEAVVQVKKGWNRMLCKVSSPPKGKGHGAYPLDWAVDISFRAVDTTNATRSNIVWATRLPERAYAGTLVVGDKIFVMAEPGDLICLNKQDGKPLWVQSLTYFDVLDEKEQVAHPEIASLRKELDAWNQTWLQTGNLSEKLKTARHNKLHWDIAIKMSKLDPKTYASFSGRNLRKCTPTPVCDGRHVYVWLSCGLGACFDLNGNRKWNVSTTLKSGGEHGSHSSPALLNGKVIYQVASELIAVDAASGKILWQREGDKNEINANQSPVPVRIQGKDVFLHAPALIDPADGRVLGTLGIEGVDKATPVLVDGVLYGTSDRSHLFFKWQLPSALTSNSMALTRSKGVKLCSWGGSIQHAFIVASPLVHEGLAYIVSVEGMLYVVDTEKDELVFTKSLGLGREGSPLYFKGMCFNSPMLAGEHIYVSGVEGITVVFKPGRTYQEVARNRIEETAFCAPYADRDQRRQPETFTSTPVADGDRLYLRGTEFLYCIGENN